jgi:hypothetical protein
VEGVSVVKWLRGWGIFFARSGNGLSLCGYSESEQDLNNSVEIPKFRSKTDEAEWWASEAGRNFVKKKSRALRANSVVVAGSRLVSQLNRKGKSTQIAIRLPEEDIAQARKIAEGKGVGYQTLLKMLVHEGLRRESRRG